MPVGPRDAKIRTPEEVEARRAKDRARHAAARASGKERYVPLQQRREATAARTGTRVPTVRRGIPDSRRTLSVALVADALARTGGLIGVAADLLHVAHRSVFRYVARYPSLQQVRDDAREHALDDAEWALIRAARKGEPWAVQWFLKHQGKTRGYQDVHKTEQDTRVQVEVTYTEDALGAGRPLTTVHQLPAPGALGAPSASAAEPRTRVAVEVVEADDVPLTYPRREEG